MYITVKVEDFSVCEGTKKDYNKTQKLIERNNYEELEYLIDNELDGKLTFKSDDPKVVKFGELLINYNKHISGLDDEEFIPTLLSCLKLMNSESLLEKYFIDMYDLAIDKMIKILTRDERWQSTALQVCTFNDEWQSLEGVERYLFVEKFDKLKLYNLLPIEDAKEIINPKSHIELIPNNYLNINFITFIKLFYKQDVDFNNAFEALYEATKK